MNDGLPSALALTPLTVYNRPGLPALYYRIGTHGSFLSTMLARLASHSLPGTGARPLAALATRSPDDLTIALLDAWAMTLDVLTFYQERLINEGFLRTATERGSVLQLARLVGYALRPGVAATGFLAYTLDRDPQTGERQTMIPAGSKVQSMPLDNEQPQTFETAEGLDARASWNVLGVRRWRPSLITKETLPGLPALYFEGVGTNLQPGSPLLLVWGKNDANLVFAQKVTQDFPSSRTEVPLQARIGPSFKDFASNLQNLAKLPDVIARSQIAQNVNKLSLQPVTGLVQQQEKAQEQGQRTDPDTVVQLIQDKLPSMQEHLAQARTRGREALADWLQRAVNGLQVIASQLAAAQAEEDDNGTGDGKAADPAAVAAARAAEGDSSKAALLRLGTLLGSLRQTRSQPPPSSRDMARSVGGLFNPASELNARMLVALTPRLGDNLYQAWGNAPVGAPALQSVQALRQTARPFGVIAPPRPVFDQDGKQGDTDEWPLVSVVVGIRVVAAKVGPRPGSGWSSR